jgi:hypothetical protein
MKVSYSITKLEKTPIEPASAGVDSRMASEEYTCLEQTNA